MRGRVQPRRSGCGDRNGGSLLGFSESFPEEYQVKTGEMGEGVVDKSVATGDLLVGTLSASCSRRTPAATSDICAENPPFPQIIFVPRLFICAAVLRASEGLAEREPGGPLDLCSMHCTYSGNYSFFNALTFSVISSELMQPQTEASPLRTPERV